MCDTVALPTTRPTHSSPHPLLSSPNRSWERRYDAFTSALRQQQNRLEGGTTDPGIGALVNQELGKLQGTDRLGLR